MYDIVIFLQYEPLRRMAVKGAEVNGYLFGASSCTDWGKHHDNLAYSTPPQSSSVIDPDIMLL